METLFDMRSPTGDQDIVAANYNKVSESIRRYTPHGIQCSVFCGGTHCKYENPESWSPDNIAVQGLYSHWITDHVLAMARPSTVVIIQKNIIQQFQSLGIKSIINLQCPNEHASCGQPLEDSGFSYDPNIFMENSIYYYNFAWKDYGDATLIGLLNMVKVVAFAASEGKVAIHCHAGLGRTGVLIACYLVYSLRVQANAAIKYVRLRRPGSVQTRGQILCVTLFAQYILPNLITYYIKDHSHDKTMVSFTLTRFLKKQKIALHGYEERNYKHLPKIIHKICERILKLSGCWINDFSCHNTPFTTDFLVEKVGLQAQRNESIYSICSNYDASTFLSATSSNLSSSTIDVFSVDSTPPSPNTSDISDDTINISEIDEELIDESLLDNKCYQKLEIDKTYSNGCDDSTIVLDMQEVTDALVTADVATLNAEQKKSFKCLQHEINSSQLGWMKLDMLTDITILATLLYDWIESLKTPILDSTNLEIIVVHYKNSESCLTKLENNSSYLIEYLLIFLSKLQLPTEFFNEVLLRIIAALTQQYVMLRSTILPQDRNFRKLRGGTKGCIIKFLTNLLKLVTVHHQDKSFVGRNMKDCKCINEI